MTETAVERPLPNRFEAENEVLREMLVQAGIDAHAHSTAAQLQTVLIGELHHRVKNMLAIVSAITTQSLRSATDLREASVTIAARIHALGVAQDLLMRESWTGAGCLTLIEGAVRAFQSKGPEHFVIEGVDLPISSGPAISLSLVIHELCTNAMKYGALSVPEGRVAIKWSVDAGRFKLHWQESGGPPVTAPSRKSFGSKLIEQALPGQLQGEARLNFEASGVRCEINIPVEALQSR